MTHTITVRVDGGMVTEVEGVPEGVTVRVVDYDVDGVDEADTVELEGGDRAIVRHFEAE